MKGAKESKKKVEKTSKNFQKSIDNGKTLWYTIEAVAKKGQQTVIEN